MWLDFAEVLLCCYYLPQSSNIVKKTQSVHLLNSNVLSLLPLPYKVDPYKNSILRFASHISFLFQCRFLWVRVIAVESVVELSKHDFCFHDGKMFANTLPGPSRERKICKGLDIVPRCKPVGIKFVWIRPVCFKIMYCVDRQEYNTLWKYQDQLWTEINQEK